MIILNEGLEEVANGVFCTDYVGDVVNWILHKPKNYRLVYNSDNDAWCVSLAYRHTHRQMAIDMVRSGFIPVSEKAMMRVKGDPEWYRGEDLLAKATNLAYDYGSFRGLMFVPYKSKFDDHGTGFYTLRVPIESGWLLIRYFGELQRGGEFGSLRDKLESIGAISQKVLDGIDNNTITWLDDDGNLIV